MNRKAKKLQSERDRERREWWLGEAVEKNWKMENAFKTTIVREKQKFVRKFRKNHEKNNQMGKENTPTPTN